jgi:hypothetical protein
MEQKCFVCVYVRMYVHIYICTYTHTQSKYRGADKSLARPTSQCVFYGENISFDASLVAYMMCVVICVEMLLYSCMLRSVE